MAQSKKLQSLRKVSQADRVEIVRLLERYGLGPLLCTVQDLRCPVCGAKLKVTLPAVPIGEHTLVEFSQSPPEWDSDRYFRASQPTRLTVPPGLEGRYFIQAAIRWTVFPEQIVNAESCFAAQVLVNGSSAGPDARSQANLVTGEATGATQSFTFETNLAAKARVELRIWQGIGPAASPEIRLLVRRLGPG